MAVDDERQRSTRSNVMPRDMSKKISQIFARIAMVGRDFSSRAPSS